MLVLQADPGAASVNVCDNRRGGPRMRRTDFGANGYRARFAYARICAIALWRAKKRLLTGRAGRARERRRTARRPTTLEFAMNIESKAATASLLRLERSVPARGPATEDERMIRDAAAAFAADKLAPRIEEAYLEEKTDPAIFREMGEAGLLGITIPEEYGGARRRLRHLRAGRARGRARRFRLPLDDERAVLAGDVSDPCLRLGGAAQEVPAEARLRRMDRLLRPDRARCRLRSRRHEDARREDRRRLPPHRLQDVDLQRADRRRLRRLGEVGRA